MYIQLAMGFGLELPLPAQLNETSCALPADIFPFWRAVEPAMCTIMNRHPRRDPDDPLMLLRAFRRYMDTVPRVKDSRQRWCSTAERALPGPTKNRAYWMHYDPLELNQVPYVAWFLTQFSGFITKTGLDFGQD